MKVKILLTIIILIAFFLRFYQLGTNPPALTWDEAAWGHNAYTLGTFGRDEFGKALPVTHLESFGDFKPPLYAYLSILPIKIFGLTEFGVRFTSAFFGTLTVLLAFFLVRRIFYNSKHKDALGYVVAGVLAISPWHILLSRAAFEANVASFFTILGAYLFLVAVQDAKKRWLIVASFVSLVLSMYTFNTARIFSPILGAILVLGHIKVIWHMKKQFIIGAIVAIAIGFPLFMFLRTPQAQLRYQEVNIFSDVSVIKRVNQEIQNDNNAYYSRVIHNRRLAYTVEYLRHYFDNLRPSFLFINGDGNPKFAIQDVGQMYLWEAPFLILGIFLLFKKREGVWWLVPLWLVTAIIPAATARETPHALRIETTIPMFQILVAYGLFYAFKKVSSIKYQVLSIRLNHFMYLIFACGVLFSFLYFAHSYFVTYPIIYAREWQYGYKQAIQYVNSVKGDYEKIYITEDLGRPYIYILFYGQEQPENFMGSAKIRREAAGFVHVDSFGKYIFADTLPNNNGNYLYINSPGKVPGNADIKQTFYLPNGDPILVAYTL